MRAGSFGQVGGAGQHHAIALALLHDLAFEVFDRHRVDGQAVDREAEVALHRRRRLGELGEADLGGGDQAHRQRIHLRELVVEALGVEREFNRDPAAVAALHEMRSAADAASRGMSAGTAGVLRPIRVALAGGALTEQMARDSARLSTLEVVATGTDTAGATAALAGVSADVLVIELPTLQRESLALVDALVHAVGARRAVVAYRYGPAAVVSALRNRGHTVTRAPLDLDELERLCREAASPEVMHASPGSSPQPLDAVPERRFDDPSLARFARSLTTLYCECPRHIVDLLIGLGSFERYSAECANRGPEDAVLHQYLERVAGSARALFEEALVRIARAEGIAIPK